MGIKLHNKGHRVIEHNGNLFEPGKAYEFTPDAAAKLKRLYPDEVVSLEDEIKAFEDKPSKKAAPEKAPGKAKAEKAPAPDKEDDESEGDKKPDGEGEKEDAESKANAEKNTPPAPGKAKAAK